MDGIFRIAFGVLCCKMGWDLGWWPVLAAGVLLCGSGIMAAVSGFSAKFLDHG